MKFKHAAITLLVIVVASAALWVMKSENSAEPARGQVNGHPASTGAPAAVHAPRTRVGVARELEASDSKSPAGLNAADVYKDAFALLGSLTAEEKLILAGKSQENDPTRKGTLFKKLQPILVLLRKASEADYCDWSLGEFNFSQMGKAFELSNAVKWAAQYQFAAGDDVAAVDTLALRAHLSHNLSETAFGSMVQTGMDANTVELLRDNAEKLSPESAASALELLRSEHYAGDFAHALETEAQIAQRYLSDPAKRKEFLSSMNMNEAMLETETAWQAQIAREFSKSLTWTDAEFQTWNDRVMKEREAHPLARMTPPMFDTIRQKIRQAQVQRAMLASGISLLHTEAAQPSSFIDPTTNAPFAYVETADGFRLESTFQAKGKPVSMTFTWPK